MHESNVTPLGTFMKLRMKHPLKKKKTNDFKTKTNFDFIAISLTGHCLLIKEAMKFGMSYIIDIQSLGITQLSVSNLLM